MIWVILTVADHEKNGFISLARWPFADKDQAKAFIAAQDDLIDPEAEPDIHTAPFTFILDFVDKDDFLDSGKKCLPTQNAMLLAPEQVQKWLEERPEPDECINRPIPLLSIT